MLEEILGAGGESLSLALLLANLGVGTVLSLVLSWHFRFFGSTLSNREEFSRIFPMIMLTTILIIAVVKGSLALSLGLVGALSIVRFRTPVKEPEELAYLFIAIAIGIGLGAEQTLATVLVAFVIMVVVAIVNRTRDHDEAKGVFVSIDWDEVAGELAAEHLEGLKTVMETHLDHFDLRRIDARPTSLEATYFVPATDAETLAILLRDLRQAFPGAGVTYLDQARLPAW